MECPDWAGEGATTAAMDDFSLKSRAIVFALCAGAVSFILALFATSNGRVDADSAAYAVVAAIICGVFCWASAERSIASTAGAVDAAIDRMAQAAKGDLESPIPDDVARCVPPLATAMEDLFGQLHNNLASVQRLALFDPVTGLANRTNFRRSAESVIDMLPPSADAALFFIDLDRFKAVNDNLGHAVGDALLAMVAERLRAVADRAVDQMGEHRPLIGRLSGDEFTILIPHLCDPAQADRVADGVLAALNRPFDLADQQVSIGASIGVAFRQHHGPSLTELMRAADAAMYHAKANGRGRAEHFSDHLASRLIARVRLESELRTAIEDGEFELAFQPQVASRSGRIVGAEALLRWHHRDGVRFPANFIQRAEETGLIVEIGEWVVGSVAATISRWADLGVEQRLAVNISPRQLDHATFFRRLHDALRRANAPARLLELEITESLAMHCSDDVIDAIAELRAEGASVAIDDFGTGYSNLARLRDLPVDRVKLDRSLVENVVVRHEARTIAQAVIGLIHGLNCEAVAEGIESVEQADVLRVIGCDVLQGYAIAQPMAEVAFLDWIREERDRAIRA